MKAHLIPSFSFYTKKTSDPIGAGGLDTIILILDTLINA
ncbi:hypothetical protein Ataiwa_36340 [Algoriphagus taiwanensis]|uniref:Uncharacterized protein n=1 Tax=Algoriphagus taiwanensis TaxID=1445656 RepID=A0ABQ6Q5H1_9BACT|nr:hypothetical protein Ataiwa_36340 [Algoriphagus taiwanensis]